MISPAGAPSSEETITSQALSPRTSRPSRIRSACTQCSIAKIKCSGDRSGCDRCRTTGAQCIYLESRVGKVQGPRTRRKPEGDRPQQGRGTQQQPQVQQHERRFSVAEENWDVASPVLGSGSTVTANDDPPTSKTDFPEEIMDWAETNWQLDSTNMLFNADKNEDFLSIQVAAPRLGADADVAADHTNAFDPSLLDGNFEQFMMQDHSPPSAKETSVQQPAEWDQSTPPMPLSLGLRPRNEVDSQCCIDCCHIISDLEGYIMAELKTFKILLGIIRKALETLSDLIRQQQSSRSLRCMMLFTTLMYQIYELLEVCYTTITEERGKQRRLAVGSSRLGLGDFSAIDLEEQSVMRIQSIVREAQQALEIVGQLRALAAVGPDQARLDAGADSSTGRARGDCYLDLEFRFRNLSILFQKGKEN